MRTGSQFAWNSSSTRFRNSTKPIDSINKKRMADLNSTHEVIMCESSNDELKLKTSHKHMWKSDKEFFLHVVPLPLIAKKITEIRKPCQIFLGEKLVNFFHNVSLFFLPFLWFMTSFEPKLWSFVSFACFPSTKSSPVHTLLNALQTAEWLPKTEKRILWARLAPFFAPRFCCCFVHESFFSSISSFETFLFVAKKKKELLSKLFK